MSTANATLTSVPRSRVEKELPQQHAAAAQNSPRRSEIPEEVLAADVRLREYTSAANPTLSQIPVLTHPPSLHASGASTFAHTIFNRSSCVCVVCELWMTTLSFNLTGPTRVIPFDLSQQLGVSYAATSPNLLASYLRVCAGEALSSQAVATSQAFYVIRGAGSTSSEFGMVNWSEGTDEHRILTRKLSDKNT